MSNIRCWTVRYVNPAAGTPVAEHYFHPRTRNPATRRSGSSSYDRPGILETTRMPSYERSIGAIIFKRGEPPRVQPSKRRASKHPLIEIGRARRKEDALAGLERWKRRHPRAAAHLESADVLVDAMRGRFTTWTRIRVNLQHVPADLRPTQEALDPDEKTVPDRDDGADAYS